ANTFLAAAGHQVGKSLYEPELIEQAKNLMAKTEIPIPVDVVVASEFAETAAATVKSVSEIAEDDMILDVGPETAAQLAGIIGNMRTIIWNGPLGVFEFEQFSGGTRIVAEAVANSTAFSIAGGGETIAAIDKFQVTDRISYISTGGGAFLEYVQGSVLPAVHILESRG
ncbi:MAG: phosphoglycerate kinase, partial [Gammaproteobacteria bacterium]|nr:phosphoglycerate kinase [Gammaproteobacteria bacterium]